jgi:hypothetical protein
VGSELNVDPQALKQAAEGITGVIGELSDLGTKETGAAGRGFSEIALSPLDAGKQSVQQAFRSFADRWSWGIRTLVQSGNALAQTLGLAAGRFYMMDQEFSNMLKEMYTDVAGNPHLTTQQVDDRSWKDTLLDNSFNDAMHPDYSLQSFENALHHVGTNAQVIATVAPTIAEQPLRWNTGDAARAAQIQAGGNK